MRMKNLNQQKKRNKKLNYIIIELNKNSWMKKVSRKRREIEN